MKTTLAPTPECIERITPSDAFVELRFTQNGHRQTEHEFVRTNKDTDNGPSFAVNIDMSNVFGKLQVASEWQNLYDTNTPSNDTSMWLKGRYGLI
jgi:hypothetical protein